MKTAIDPELAGKLLANDESLLVMKLNEGKRLSTADRKRLEQITAGSSEEIAASKVDLAKHLGIARQNLDRWLKRHGAPKAKPDGTWSITAVRAFIDSCKGEVPEDDEGTLLRRRKLRAETEQAEMENKITAGEYWPRALTIEFCGHAMIMIRQCVEAQDLSDEVKDRVLETIASLDFKAYVDSRRKHLEALC